MQTTKLILTLTEPDLPVPDAGDYGRFTGSLNGVVSPISIVVTLILLTVVLSVVVYKAHESRKNKGDKANREQKLGPLVVAVFVSGLLFAIFASFIANNNATIATDAYVPIEATETVDLEGEIGNLTFTYGKATITKIDATNYGYNLYIKAGDTSLVPNTEENKTIINTISEPGILNNNTYGFRLVDNATNNGNIPTKDDVWYPITELQNILATYTTSTSINNTTDIYFGVLTNEKVLPGTYSLDINFYATNILATINDLTHMQDFKSISRADLAGVKTSMTTGQQYELQDSRDGKTYWIAKLKDGNIWMTENLDHDIIIDPTKPYTSENTDLNLYGSKGYDANNGYSCSNSSALCEDGVISWTPERATILQNELNSMNWKNDAHNPYSWQGTENECPNNPNESCNDGHSYANNYYNWTAAIANNNSSSYSEGIADNSICPAGWRLPNVAPTENGYEFSKLLFAYNIVNNNGSGGGYTEGGYDHIVSDPLYLVQSGYINGGSIVKKSEIGYYYSSAIINENGAYRLSLSQSSIYPAGGYPSRNYGFSIRCLVR